MTLLEEIFKGGAEGIFSGIKGIIGAFKADPTVMAQNAQKIMELEIATAQAQMQADLQIQLAQSKVNEIEAGSNDKFASRWRPAAGWLGVIGLAYSVIIYPLLTWASLNLAWKTPPELDVSVLVTLLMGMLGLGTMRTYEKVQGVTGNLAPVRPK